METLLRRYVSPFIQDRLAQIRHGWLAELRRLTILFLSLQLDYNDPDALQTLQRAVTAVQDVLYRYEGNWSRIVVDEKGTNMLMVLGLPPFTHENDPLRGVQMALALNPVFASLGVTGTMGITTGRVFCGEVGNARRREYTFLGNGVNLAARLMKAAVPFSQGAGIIALCDQATYQATQDHITYDAMPPLTLKGLAEPISVYWPLSPVQSSLVARQEMAAQWPLLGRETELAFLRQQIDALAEDGESRVVLIEGEAGIGKSHLAEVALQYASQQHIPGLFATADAIEKATPYHAWRGLFGGLLGIQELERLDSTAVHHHLQTHLSQSPELLPLLPLLNPVLGVDIPDTETTAQMNLENRADNTRDLLLTLLQRETNPGLPYLLLVEDAQWLDSASWQVLAALRERVRPWLILLTARTDSLEMASLPEEASRLWQESHHLKLEALSGDTSLELVQQRLGVDSLPNSVATLIRDTAEGHPFFSEEIAYALRDEGYILVEDGRCRLTPAAANLQTIQFPNTIEGVITTRISRLSTEQQLTVKVASVIGRVFALSVLAGIYPIPEERDHIPTYVTDLDRLNITPYYSTDPELSYVFRHILSREVAYNLMLYAQRQQLHQAVGRWYEIVYAEDLNRIYPLLAYHWHEAARLGPTDEETASKAIAYLDKAGEQALHHGAMREAAQFFGDLLNLLKQIPVGSPIQQQLTAQQIGRWQRQMGEAVMRSGRQHEAIPYLEEALRQLGFSVTHSSGTIALRVMGQYGRQIFHRLAPGRFLSSHTADADRLLEAARAFDLLGEAWYLLDDPIRASYYTICRMNAAELAPPSPQRAAYASVCMTMSLVGLESVADGYADLALTAAAEMDDLSTRGLAILRVCTHYLAYCRWPEVLALAEQIDAICAQISDWQLWATNKALIAPTGRYSSAFELSLAAALDGQNLARRSGNRIHETWGVLNESVALLAMGEVTAASERLEALLELLPLAPTLTVEMTAYGALAVAYWRQGKQAQAREMADRGLHLFGRMLPVAFFTLPGYGGVTETYLRLLAEIPQDSELQAKAKQAMKVFKRFARSFPFARPYLHLCLGLEAWLNHKPDKAYQLWQKGIALAETQAMPYEKGLLLVEYGQRCLSAHHPDGQSALTEAAQIFERLGCRYELAA
jgi:tetratricopeptide (TPR) repeat protein